MVGLFSVTVTFLVEGGVCCHIGAKNARKITDILADS